MMNKRNIAFIAIISIVGLLSGCTSESSIVDGIIIGQQIAVTAISTEVADSEDWKELGSLTSYPEARAALDQFYQIMSVDGAKTGILYVKPDNSGTTTNNSCLLYAFQNNRFQEDYLTTAKIAEVTQLAVKHLGAPAESGFQAAINSYYDLIKFDEQSGGYKGDKVISRVEAMAATYKALNPRPMGGITDSDAYRAMQVTQTGTTERIASYMDDKVYLQAGDKSLNGTTAKEGMTRGEAVYMLANLLHPEDMQAPAPTDEQGNSTLASATLAGQQHGDIGVLSGIEKVSDNGSRTILPEASLYTRSSELKYALDMNIIPDEFYKAYSVAEQHEWMDGKGTWDEVLSCDEFIDLLLNALESYGCDHIASDGYGAYIDEHGYTDQEALLENGNATGELADGLYEDASEEEIEYNNARLEEEHEEAVENGTAVTEENLEEAQAAINVEPLDKTMYAVSSVNVRAGDSTDFDKIGGLSWAQEVKVTGRSVETKWFQIEFTDSATGEKVAGYVSNNYLSDTKPQSPPASSGNTAAATTPAPAATTPAPNPGKRGKVNMGFTPNAITPEAQALIDATEVNLH
ncbi:MAG: SH3 domain-containing protein [Oscillospiraceae bacterium]|nr:SH3 domain-containing protein [Oscillospiraceae bacterium]